MGIFDTFRKKKIKEDTSKENDAVLEEQINKTKYLTMDNIEEVFICYLKDNSWQVELSNNTYKSSKIESRYKNIPKSWEKFMGKYDLISNADDTTWFLCFKDYDDENASFKYNEFELISLDSSTNDEEKDIINKFWDENIPIILSVKDGYHYYAINLESGKVIYGLEPEFEESNVVAETFEEFIKKILLGDIIL